MHFSFRFFIERSGDWREKYQVRIVSLFLSPLRALIFPRSFFPVFDFSQLKGASTEERKTVILINRYICKFIRPLFLLAKKD